MAEETPEDIRKRRRAEREAKHAARRAEVKRRNAEQTEDVEDIAADLDLAPEHIVKVATDAGVVACKKAAPHEISRFLKNVNPVNRTGGRRGKNPPDYDELVQGLVRSARIYPESDAFETILAEYPLVWHTLADALTDMAGGTFEADVSKN
jgi:hypothetical protein